MKSRQYKTCSITLRDGMLTIVQFSGKKIAGQVTIPAEDLQNFSSKRKESK